MSTPLFKSLIKCAECNWSYKFKKQRLKNTYVCGGASSNGKEFCNLKKIEENDLIFLIKTQFAINEIEWIADNEYISNHVKNIVVDENSNIEINYHKLPTTMWKNDRIIHSGTTI